MSILIMFKLLIIVKYPFLLLLITLLYSCVPVENEDVGDVLGVRPIYLNKQAFKVIESLPPRPFEDLGQIVTVGNYIYINERYEGIHVIDNSDPSTPVTLHFWQIDGNLDFTISGNRLYADNGYDLYTIDISDPGAIVLVSTVEDIYGPIGETALFPPDYSGFFECVDPSLGLVVEWEDATLNNPRCDR